MGTEVSMVCAVRGFPVPMVHWFKDGCLLTNCSASFSLQNNGQLLTFRSNTAWDKRNINSLLFFCQIIMMNQELCTIKWCIDYLFCTVWSFASKVLLYSCWTEFKIWYLAAFPRNVTKEDEGSYHCEASNQKDSIKSQPAFLLPAGTVYQHLQETKLFNLTRVNTFQCKRKATLKLIGPRPV